MDFPSGMGFHPLSLVWSQREKRKTSGEIKAKNMAMGEGEGGRKVTEQKRSVIFLCVFFFFFKESFCRLDVM